MKTNKLMIIMFAIFLLVVTGVKGTYTETYLGAGQDGSLSDDFDGLNNTILPEPWGEIGTNFQILNNLLTHAGAGGNHNARLNRELNGSINLTVSVQVTGSNLYTGLMICDRNTTSSDAVSTLNPSANCGYTRFRPDIGVINININTKDTSDVAMTQQPQVGLPDFPYKATFFINNSDYILFIDDYSGDILQYNNTHSFDFSSAFIYTNTGADSTGTSFDNLTASWVAEAEIPNTPPPMINDSEWNTPATDPDADNINTTFDWDAVVDDDSDPVTYLFYMNLTGADYELLYNGSSTSYLVNFSVETDYKYRVDTYDGEDTTTGAERIFTFDTTEPVLQIFDPVNNTIYEQNIENITVDIECTDDNVYILNYTFYNASQIFNSIQNDTPDGRYLSTTTDVDISNRADGDYQFTVECSDTHTNNNIPNYGVNYDGDSITYDVGGNEVKVTLEMASNQINSISSVKEADRYTFNFDVDPTGLGGYPNSRYNFWFRIESMLPIVYLSESNYDAHFITGDNWIDLENDDEGAMYTVVKVSDYVYRVKVLTNDLNFHSIGGLNIVEQTFDFTLDECDPIYFLADSSDLCYINDTGLTTDTYSDVTCGYPNIINYTEIVYCDYCFPTQDVNVFCYEEGSCLVGDYTRECNDLNNSCYNTTGLSSDDIFTYSGSTCVGSYADREIGEVIIDFLMAVLITIVSLGAIVGLILVAKWMIPKVKKAKILKKR